MRRPKAGWPRSRARSAPPRRRPPAATSRSSSRAPMGCRCGSRPTRRRSSMPLCCARARPPRSRASWVSVRRARARSTVIACGSVIGAISPGSASQHPRPRRRQRLVRPRRRARPWCGRSRRRGPGMARRSPSRGCSPWTAASWTRADAGPSSKTRRRHRGVPARRRMTRLRLGTRVRLTGFVGKAYGAPRLKVNDVRVLGTGTPTARLAQGSPTASTEWRLVRATGHDRDVHRSGDRWTAELTTTGSDQDPASADSPAAGSPATSVVEGRSATVTGIVKRPYPDGNRPSVRDRAAPLVRPRPRSSGRGVWRARLPARPRAGRRRATPGAPGGAAPPGVSTPVRRTSTFASSTRVLASGCGSAAW